MKVQVKLCGALMLIIIGKTKRYMVIIQQEYDVDANTTSQCLAATGLKAERFIIAPQVQ